MSPRTSRAAAGDAGGWHHFGGADREGRCCPSRPGGGVWQQADGRKPCCEEPRMWQRVRRRMGWGQGAKGSPRQERERHQHASQPWPHGSCQPCALRRSLQLPPATARGSPCPLQFARQRPRTEAAPVVPAERGLLAAPCPPCQPAQPRSSRLGAGATSPPPSAPPSPGPGKRVCDPRTDAGAFPGAVS